MRADVEFLCCQALANFNAEDDESFGLTARASLRRLLEVRFNSRTELAVERGVAYSLTDTPCRRARAAGFPLGCQWTENRSRRAKIRAAMRAGVRTLHRASLVKPEGVLEITAAY
jgi:hypothetical protein